MPEAFVLAAETRSRRSTSSVSCSPDPAMLYTAMTLQPTLMNEVNYQLREMAGGSVIQLPSSYASFGDPTSAADIDRYIRWPDVDADDRVALLKLAWDAIGSEFAGRHQQYEMFYAGEAERRADAGVRRLPLGSRADRARRSLPRIDARRHAGQP